MESINIPNLSAIQSSLDQCLGARKTLLSRKQSLKEEVLALDHEEGVFTLVVELFRQLADAEIAEAVKPVETLQTEGIRAVFPDQDLTVEALVEMKRGKVCVELETVRTYEDGTVVRGKSIETSGGSITTLQSVLMRIIVMLKHGLRPFLVLDESLMAIENQENQYVDNTGQLLRSLSEKLGIDMLVITHNTDLAQFAHNHYKLVNPKGPVSFEKLG